MLLYEVEKNDKDAFIVGEKKKNQPTLYRDFPLIGSEKFHFPFFLDGFRFNPLETRNGLYLNGDSNEEVIENRNIIGESVKYSIYFTKYLIEQNLNKRYLLAQSKIPEPPQRYDSIAIKWFTELQKNWRTELVKLRLVKDRKGSTYNRLNSLKLPLFKEKFNIDFFNLFAKLNVTCENIPTDEEAKIWYNILEEDPLKKVYGIEENTWNFKFAFTEIDLLKTIKEYGSIIKFAEIMNTDAETIISWLNELYTFLQKNDCMNYLFEYEIIPNKKGEFRKVDDLCRCDKEKNNLIPDIIEPIYNYIFGKEINEIYVHKDIIFNSYEKYFKKKNFKHILNEFSNYLKENNKIDSKIYLCKHLISIVREGEKLKRMFQITIETDRNFRYNQDEKLNYYQKYHSVWRDVEEFWFSFHSTFIESLKNIDNLRKVLGFSDSKEGRNQCINWLNEYLLFLKENSTIVERKKIFPNQLGIFENLINLRYDDSIPEILKDIYNKLQSTEDKPEEIRHILLLKEITSFKGYNKFTKEEIIGKIENLFNKSENSKLKVTISEEILSFIPNKNDEKFIEISKVLKEFISYYNQILGKNIILKETKAMTELNYGMFLNFILKDTLNNIESMSINEILLKKEYIPKIIKFSWVCQPNKYLKVLVDPTLYKIFINQSNKVTKFANINYAHYFPTDAPEIVQILELSELQPINLDFKQNILCKCFADELKDYKYKFNQLKLEQICKNEIDYKLVEYYEQNKNGNLLEKKHESFRRVFFKLNEILKSSPYLKQSFPRLIRYRGAIALSFLDVSNDMEEFIEDIKRMVNYKLTD